MGFGSYDEGEQQEESFDEDEEDYTMSEKMRKARHEGKEEMNETTVDDMLSDFGSSDDEE